MFKGCIFITSPLGLTVVQGMLFICLYKEDYLLILNVYSFDSTFVVSGKVGIRSNKPV